MRYILRHIFTALLVIFLVPASAFSSELNSDQLAAANVIQTRLSVISDLAQHNIITNKQANTATLFYCQQALPIIGHAVTPAEIASITSTAKASQGFGAFLNTLIVFAGVALLLSFIGLVGYYLRDLLLAIPATVYEGVAYLLTSAIFVGCYFSHPFDLWFLSIQPLWLLVPGALGFAGCLYLSYFLHWVPSEQKAEGEILGTRTKFYAGPGLKQFHINLAGLCAVTWGTLAVVYHEGFPNAGIPHFLAFISVTALQAYLGFSVITVPGCIAMGWTEKDAVPRSTLSSLVLLTLFVSPAVMGAAVPETLRVFERGCIFMGAFVYYLGLLVMSSKWYSNNKQRQGRYWLMQAITVASGIAAFYFGSSFHIPALLGIGGTFFTIYLLEKYYEIPWKGVGWAWSLLGVALAMYFFVGFAGHNPQYFIWGMHLS